MNRDILFRQDGFIFSYRVAGVLIRDGRILLQKPENDGYAFIGGHAEAFEASRETLAREFREELRADVDVGRLLAVGEIFFPWGDRPCHQIALYYAVSLKDESQIPLDDVFRGWDELGGERIDLDFCWVPLEELPGKEVYPAELVPHLLGGSTEVLHFVSRQLENTPTLETPRLILRRFAPEDIPAILEMHRDEEVNRFLPWFPLKTLEQARDFYRERYETVYAQPWGYAYAICLKGDDVPIGYAGVELGGANDLGYGLRREFWHQGIVSEAAKALLERVRADGLPFVTATHDVNNPRSGAVMRAAGMKYCYSYEEQWMPKNVPVTFRMYQLNLDGRDDRVYRGYWEKYARHFVEENL